MGNGGSAMVGVSPGRENGPSSPKARPGPVLAAAGLAGPAARSPAGPFGDVTPDRPEMSGQAGLQGPRRMQALPGRSRRDADRPRGGMCGHVMESPGCRAVCPWSAIPVSRRRGAVPSALPAGIRGWPAGSGDAGWARLPAHRADMAGRPACAVPGCRPGGHRGHLPLGAGRGICRCGPDGPCRRRGVRRSMTGPALSSRLPPRSPRPCGAGRRCRAAPDHRAVLPTGRGRSRHGRHRNRGSGHGADGTEGVRIPEPAPCPRDGTGAGRSGDPVPDRETPARAAGNPVIHHAPVAVAAQTPGRRRKGALQEANRACATVVLGPVDNHVANQPRRHHSCRNARMWTPPVVQAGFQTSCGMRSRHCRMSGLSMQHSFAACPSYDQKQRVEKKRRLYIVPRAFLWKTPRLPCRFHVSILHTGSPLPAVMA